MDLDAEMERLRKEARAKLDAERAAEPAGEAPRDEADAEVDAEAMAEASRLIERTAAGAGMSMGGKIAAVLVGLVLAWAALVFVVAPLLKIAFVLGIIVAVVWVVLKLTDDDDDEGEGEGEGGKDAP